MTLKRTLQMLKMAKFILRAFCHNFKKCDEKNKTNTLVQEETGYFSIYLGSGISSHVPSGSGPRTPGLCLGHQPRAGLERKRLQGCAGLGGPAMEGAVTTLAPRPSGEGAGETRESWTQREAVASAEKRSQGSPCGP